MYGLQWASCQIRNIAGCACTGMPETFSPPSRFNDPDMYHGTCVTHVPWCMPGSLTSGCLWSWWRRKRSWHSLRMRNLNFYVSGKRPICWGVILCWRKLLLSKIRPWSLQCLTYPYREVARPPWRLKLPTNGLPIEQLREINTNSTKGKVMHILLISWRHDEVVLSACIYLFNILTHQFRTWSP